MLDFRFNDGGRQEVGFRGSAGDCVVRAAAIAGGFPYRNVYRLAAQINQNRGGSRSARDGAVHDTHDCRVSSFLDDYGARCDRERRAMTVWTPRR